MTKTPRRPLNAMDAAEALFKPAKKEAAPAVERPAIPNSKETVSIRLDSEVLAFFQEDGPGWQDRINDALRQVMTSSRSL
ncbi:BrnA antitoxin family protein [Rhizobium sp. C4]|uniref:BrnA antitoxin family protein n=1 Tax=Rhizobium sp. C4 TaxID=1349800 RepID=UPI001E58E264|nr:BrnA antitoxin family protein [Rhizobium sp. C4]MCD2172335.1 BrnA antitoxin family protein [Rhizobium sp. C4]